MSGAEGKNDTDDRDADLPSTWTAWGDTVRLAWAAWPLGLLARTGISVINSLVRGIGLAWALRQVIDSAAAHRPFVLWALVLVLMAAIDRWIEVGWGHVQRMMMLRVQHRVSRRVMELADDPVGVEHLESPRYLDRIDQLTRNPERISILFDFLASIAGSGVTLVAALVALAALHPVLVVPVFVAGGLGTLHARSRRQTLALMDRATVDQRLGDRLAITATAATAAFDVRMLTLSSWLTVNHRESRDRVRRSILRGEQKVVAATGIAAVLQAVILTASVAFLIRLAGQGSLTAGEVAMGVVLLRSGINEASGMGEGVADLARNTFVARRYSWLARYQGSLPLAAEPTSPPQTLARGIEFRDLSFEYPGAEGLVLEGVNLFLPAGTTVALVGENGAGKTTLVKLLARLYDPSAGSIEVDGVDLRNVDHVAWRRRLTGAFQDFTRFHFTVGNAIGIGEPSLVDDEVSVADAAARGNSASFIEGLEHQYSTQLGRDLGGVEVSEGQWQRLAISRASMRTEPLLVLLDEPTAALDPQAEHDLFERYARTAREARARGAITIVVSHRFSTVRMADLIVVVDKGRIVEKGSHAELVAGGGLYAELYGLQAERFQS